MSAQKMHAIRQSPVDPRHVRKMVRCSANVVCQVVLAAAAWAQTSNRPLPVLTHADQVRQLSPEQAAMGYPVHIRGVVTDDVPAPDFFVQDSSAGVYVEGAQPVHFTHHFGDLMEVEGVTGPGKFAPVVIDSGRGIYVEGAQPVQ